MTFVVFLCEFVNGGLVIRRHFAQKNHFFATFLDKTRNANILFYRNSSKVSERSIDSINKRNYQVTN